MKGVPVRLAELLAALSLATDLGMGQPSGHAVQTCVLSVRLARDLGLPDDQVSDVFYVALLRYLGCTADASEVARLSGDEIGLAVAVGPYVMGDIADRVTHTDVEDPEQTMATAMAIHCEAAGMLGARLGLGEALPPHFVMVSNDGTGRVILAAWPQGRCRCRSGSRCWPATYCSGNDWPARPRLATW